LCSDMVSSRRIMKVILDKIDSEQVWARDVKSILLEFRSIIGLEDEHHKARVESGMVMLFAAIRKQTSYFRMMEYLIEYTLRLFKYVPATMEFVIEDPRGSMFMKEINRWCKLNQQPPKKIRRIDIKSRDNTNDDDDDSRGNLITSSLEPMKALYLYKPTAPPMQRQTRGEYKVVMPPSQEEWSTTDVLLTKMEPLMKGIPTVEGYDSDDDPEKIIGKCVRMLWPKGKEYHGIIYDYNEANRCHKFKYMYDYTENEYNFGFRAIKETRRGWHYRGPIKKSDFKTHANNAGKKNMNNFFELVSRTQNRRKKAGYS